MSLLKGKWIGTGERVITRTTGEKSPALQLRKQFTVKDFQTATCKICGLGAYVLHINGKRVGDDVLSPAFTAYDKRALYVEYDVKEYLVKGTNVVAVKLGDGFYNQTTRDTWGFYQAPWRDMPKLWFSLRIDGEVALVSDVTWKCSTDGATVHNAIRTGEYYDARKEDGWREVGYDDCGWQNACIVASPGGKSERMELPPIRECERLQAVDMWRSEKGWVYDFGKNIAGYVELRLSGKRGQTAEIRYAEKLNGKELDRSNIDCYVFDTDAFSTDKYTFAGVGVETWKPEVVYHGFRYAELIGCDAPPIEELTAIFAHTDLKKKGDFQSSDELLNWIYDAGIRSFLSNWHGISEDCPHREKNGWTGDAAISADYAVANFDMKEAYKKWLGDIVDSQRVSGQLPGIAPTSGWGYNWGNGPAWDCALFFLPYALYKETGDTACFDVVFDAAEKYFRYAEYYEQDGLVCYGLSDWCPPQLPDLKLMDNRLSDSCYYYGMLSVMATICELRGEPQKEKAYRAHAEKVKQAVRKKYVHGDGVDNNGQGALAEVLYFKIVEGEQGKRIAKKLAETIKADDYKYKVGILGLKALLNALSMYGYTDVAYKTVARYDYPSYGYWKANGATTLWEFWESDSKTGTRNHHMYADVVNWLFRNVAGIKNAGVAYDVCVFEPYFFAETCSASAETETPHGKLRFAWQKKDNEFIADIEIPNGINAVLKLPNRESVKVKSGKFMIKIN